MTIFLLTFPLLALLSTLATIRIVKLRQIFLQHRLASVSSASDIDAIGCIGISILCSDPVNISVVVGLLATRYPLSEVVVVIDSASHPDLLAQLILRYSLRLNCEHAHNTFRSTQLCYRRLVVIDHKSCNNDIRADIAAQHASHNYLLRKLRLRTFSIRSRALCSNHSLYADREGRCNNHIGEKHTLNQSRTMD